jgi:nucleoid DNA-binding protein
MKKEYLKDYSIPKKVLSKVVDAFILAYQDAILQSNRVEIRGFGVLSAVLVRGKIISHPETKEQTVASPYYRITFKPSASFKEAMREKAKKEAAIT